jgi:nickel/cobalt exporter
MISALLLGLGQGARHSLEPDHLAAVSVMVGSTRDARRSMWLGAWWGLGHTVSLTAMSIAVVAFGAVLPPAADVAFAIGVGVMLIILGARALIAARRHRPDNGTVVKVRRPAHALLVGMVHGLAGSSALTALVFASLDTTAARMVYVGLFGLGSIAGMALVSGAAGWWLASLPRSRVLVWLQLLIASISIVIGAQTISAALAWP